MKYKQYNIEPVFTEYSFGGNLALYFTEENENMFGVITVNLEDDDPSNERCAFIDTNNWEDNVCDWLETNGFGKQTGRLAISGFCVYPEFEFNEQVIERYKKEN